MLKTTKKKPSNFSLLVFRLYNNIFYHYYYYHCFVINKLEINSNFKSIIVLSSLFIFIFISILIINTIGWKLFIKEIILYS